MLKSMTGYGRGKLEIDGREYAVEIKTVNHRYNDISIRLPRYLIFLEDKLRQYISKTVSRGKTDVFVSLNNLSDKGRTVKLDKKLVEIYLDEMKELISLYNVPNDITATSLIRLPDVIITENDDEEDLYWEELRKTTDIALNNLVEARELEGKRLKEDILKRISALRVDVEEVSTKSSGLLDEYKRRLEARVKELNATDIIDENRIGVEVVMFADKSSICEEVTRLRSHLKTLDEMLESDVPIGKKIDFLVQEMNREVNTIGSKANCLDITNIVVEMKNEIENIREQVQNIE